MSSSAVAPIIDLADDLEDGEIDDDDEEEESQQQPTGDQQQQQQQHTQQTQLHKLNSNDEVQFVGNEKLSNSHDDDVVFLGLTDNAAPPALAPKSKKPRPLEDDHAVSIENAIAKALKRSGIEPPMPRIHHNNNNNNNSSGGGNTGSNNNNNNNSDVDLSLMGDASSTAAGIDGGGINSASGQQQPTPSRSSRRRKRKKEREREQKKDKEYQKRARRDSMDEAGGAGASDELDMDEYEMMNVRGGSPPPGGAPSGAANAPGGRYNPCGDWADMGEGGYDSPPDNYSSYDSYSDEELANAGGAPGIGGGGNIGGGGGGGGNVGGGIGGGGGGGGGGMGPRRRQRRERDKETRGGRKRRERERDRERDPMMMDRRGGGGGGGGHDGNKRNRRDSGGDEKPREPRKMELCKFYLKDCCAKRDKCSYMHKEFPCKYYYLGMDCYAGDDCLFHHGEPLTEQLRNILLKHMETAPKEILGDFKRISRDAALLQMKRRHEQLCEQYHMENSWLALTSTGIGRLQEQQAKVAATQAAAIAAVSANLQQVVAAANAAAAAAAAGGAATGGPATGAVGGAGAGAGGGNVIPSLLDMVINPPTNLHHGGDSKPEKKRKSRWAEKSAAKANSATTAAAAAAASNAAATVVKALPAHLDLANLTQVLSAEHMAKLNKLGISNLEQMLQVPFGQLTEAGLTLAELGEIQRKADEAKPQEAGATTAAATPIPSENSSNSNSNSNNGFIMVDYTQYLKDAHVSFAGNDPLDDDREEDDEQLVIDDGTEETDDSESEPKSKKSKRNSETDDDKKEKQPDEEKEEETPPLPSVFDLPTFMSNMLGQQQAAAAAAATTTTTTTTAVGLSLNSPTDSSTEASKPFGKSHAEEKKEERPSFYREIIRNPFKTHGGDATDEGDADNDGGSTLDIYNFKYADPTSNSNSRSMTPTPTPEPGSQSPKEDELLLGSLESATVANSELGSTSIYSRLSMYDYDPAKAALEDAARVTESQRERDRDIDMRLPFEPMKHYLPATEIDAAIFSHIPIRWHMQEVLVEPPNYSQLRQHASHKEQRELRDPRLRRILGMPELTDESSSGQLGGSQGSLSSVSSSAGGDRRRERKTSNCISSPDAHDSTPSSPPPPPAATLQLQLQLPSMSVPPPLSSSGDATPTAATTATRSDPRRDPRRAHLNVAASNNSAASSSAFGGVTVAPGTLGAGDSSRQILEIRNLLQSSNWYKQLGSNNKIMVNQQLTLVFTELKKFHQLESSTKIFDVNFIVNNQTLQQIFAKLHIYIDDNGMVVQLPEEPPQNVAAVAAAAAVPVVPILPNMSQPPPNLAQLLRQPPPQVGRMVGGMPPFNQPPPSARNNNGNGNGGNGNNSGSILGMPPNVNVPNVNVMGGVMGSNPFNPFAGGNNMNNMNSMAMNSMNNMNNMNNMNMAMNNMPPNMGGMNSMNMNNMAMNNMGLPFNGANVPFKNFGGPGSNNNNGGGGGGGGGNQGRQHFAGNNRNRGNGNRNRNNN
ncbi:hypothetical protein KR093_009419 [Drosophila rubida]|uniref:C3H1-type domain-containing protein n=1 Tax=Drosophila rubida TaxID=30044 RepID=A0AAD4KEM4_9MUSC|nr:hypothetical protein KR093_009419 [Drosophila rubida]